MGSGFTVLLSYNSPNGDHISGQSGVWVPKGSIKNRKKTALTVLLWRPKKEHNEFIHSRTRRRSRGAFLRCGSQRVYCVEGHQHQHGREGPRRRAHIAAVGARVGPQRGAHAAAVDANEGPCTIGSGLADISCAPQSSQYSTRRDGGREDQATRDIGYPVEKERESVMLRAPMHPCRCSDKPLFLLLPSRLRNLPRLRRTIPARIFRFVHNSCEKGDLRKYDRWCARCWLPAHTIAVH